MSFEQAVAADYEAKMYRVACNRCFERVPRDEANTDACSGCEATYERDWKIGLLGEQLLKSFPAPAMANPVAAVVPKRVNKPCGTCGEPGHHSRNCNTYLHILLEKFQPNSEWYAELIHPGIPVYLYIVQACIKLKGDQQKLALKAWKCINRREHLTPQAVMDAVILWNDICAVAFALGKYNYNANTSHFLLKAGCSHWMRIVKEEMLNYPGIEQINTFNDDKDEVWIRIISTAQETFSAKTRATAQIVHKTYSCIHIARCSNCYELGHKRNYCPK